MGSLNTFAKDYLRHASALVKLSRDMFARGMDPARLTNPDNSFVFDVSSSLTSALRDAVINPTKVMQDNAELALQYRKLAQNVVLTTLKQPTEPVVSPERSDHRFDDEAWQRNPIYYAIGQTYLINAQYMDRFTRDLEGLTDANRRQLEFLVRQYVNALAPTNFFITNPKAVRKCRQTWGLSVVQGLENFGRDLLRSRQLLNVSMTDEKAFEVGKNIATTPGKVIFQNRLFQLIQYEPTTDRVHQTPLLVVPPFINKYYIMELTERKSLVRWLVAQGHTVFMMSWVNPDASYRDTTFEDYVQEGVLAAMDAVQEATGEREINTIGYCVGGTLLATTLAHLKKVGDDRVKSSTFFATLLDFNDPGEIGVYLNERIVQALENYIDRIGYYDGRFIALSFSSLKENNLIWSYFVNNYLMGEPPLPFDLLYWNSDSTNLPAAMYRYYLREMYLNNKLREPGALTIAGTPIDLTDIDTPAMFVSAQQDHIALWKSTYSGFRLFSGEKHFVLGQSGHIAGIINPPESGKYGYYTNRSEEENPESWFDNADHHEGSWWPHWQDWVSRFQGEEVAPRVPGDNALDVIEDAPGSYVKVRLV
ncbi:class I poly(R)-hydroxyalkanoic acid synthase [Marinobacter sp. TBZ242]|uniref:Class I poly(R)-hydroxyalkanoic acid synthase n=1 Tax=Marinobacter azerbaijanicus TaxID=3050455 RepID=A0ABT7IH35_9GAMM|nr:class I poly(R)-hydroxyalkanoic acid synthase [Marinobacter sp. TBZ242]MDL0433479.1 class I poly(R)-hydroxyalkanoic acid synthase [Marinobacter sp. TBZ242]